MKRQAEGRVKTAPQKMERESKTERFKRLQRTKTPAESQDMWAYYKAQGFNYLLPLKKDKHPAVFKWDPLFEASATDAQIEAWKKRYPSPRIGIITGIKNDLCVFDADGEEAFKELMALLPDGGFPGPIVKTPTGGFHFWCKYSKMLGGTTLEKGVSGSIDIKNSKGYVCVPPMEAEYEKPEGNPIKGKYEWVEGHSLDDVVIPEAPMKWVYHFIYLSLKSGGGLPPLVEDSRNKAIFCRVCTYVEKNPGCTLADAEKYALELATKCTRKDKKTPYPLGRAETIRSTKSAFDRVQTKTVGEEEEGGMERMPLGTPMAESLTDFMARELPPRVTLLHPILGLEELTMLHGRQKLGKSIITLQLARSLATGDDFLHFDTTRLDRNILIIQAEISNTMFQERVKKMFRGTPSEATDKIFIPDVSRGIYLNTSEGRRYVSQLLQDIDPGFVFVDPYIKFFTDEDAAFKKPKVFFEYWLEMIDRYKLSMMFVHHDAKMQEGKLGGQKSIGTSMIAASTDSNWNLDRIGEGRNMDLLEFLRVARLSFESRNWAAVRPVDIRIDDNFEFQPHAVITGLNQWDIEQEVRDAGGQIRWQEIREKYPGMRSLYGAKDRAVQEGLVLESKQGRNVILTLPNDVERNIEKHEDISSVSISNDGACNVSHVPEKREKH